MNMKLFQLINNMAYKNAFLDEVMLFFSEYVIYIFAAIIALIFLLGVIKKEEEIRLAAINTALFTVLNIVLAYLIGTVYYIDRPFVHNKVNLLYPHVADASFPSDHATVTMSIALGINKYNKVIGRILTILSLIVGFSRVYVGHHSPFDVIGTYIILFLTNYIYSHVLRYKVNNLYSRLENMITTKLNITWLYQ